MMVYFISIDLLYCKVYKIKLYPPYKEMLNNYKKLLTNYIPFSQETN